jgi:hypothetical protein
MEFAPFGQIFLLPAAEERIQLTINFFPFPIIGQAPGNPINFFCFNNFLIIEAFPFFIESVDKKMWE